MWEFRSSGSARGARGNSCPYRNYDGITDTQHVPFLLKLPGQKSSISVTDRVETLNTQKMILDIVDRKINTPEELKRWMEFKNEEKGR